MTFDDLEYHRIWRRKNPEKAGLYRARWTMKKYEYVLYVSARTRSRLRDIEFSLVPEDIIIPKYCPYLNVELTRIQGQGKVDTNASIDRINRNKGYTKDNIQIISNLANRMKNSSSMSQLLVFAENVLKLHKDKDLGTD